jgi:hypothetical protein
MHTYVAAAAAALTVLTGVAQAEFAMPTDAPVERLVRNAKAYIRQHPEDPSGYYVLGRIHYLAWSIKTGHVPVWRDEKPGEKPRVVPDAHLFDAGYRARYTEAKRRALAEFGVEAEADLPTAKHGEYARRLNAIQQQLRKENWKPKQVDQAKLDQHAAHALHNFRKAIRLEADNGLYHLGLASLAEQYARRAGELKLPYSNETKLPETEAEFVRQWRTVALEHFVKAFNASVEADGKLAYRPLDGIQSLVSYRAAEGYMRVVKALGDVKGGELVARMDAHVKQLNGLKHGPITPIVFTFAPHDSIADLLAPAVTVDFDLDGTGRDQRWPWVRPDTAILVWDPAGRGQITSGRQLFGSVTWWVLPGDGYRAMDLLDDDRDGELAGEELRGLAAWFDRNANGVSDRGEVVPIERLPIRSLSVYATDRQGRHAFNERGLRLRDGTTRPTYDWVAQPVEPR